MRKILACLFGAVLLSAAGGARAGTPCLEAVFFDLGDTLVENPGDGVFVLRPGAAETVAALQGLNLRLGIITNVPSGWDLDDLRALLAEPAFLDEFEVVILSSQAPAPKPNPAIYTFAHGALAEPRPPITATAFVGETLSEIGNHATSPTLGARSVGMVGIHLSDAAPSPLADFTIASDSLHHVIAIVETTCASSGVETGSVEIGGLRMGSTWPNPSSGQTRIAFAVHAEGRVAVEVFDVLGGRVTTLIDRIIPAGEHEVFWDGRRADGRLVPGGAYYTRIRSGRDVVQSQFVRLPKLP